MVIGQKWFLSWFIFWWFAHMVESSSAQWIKLIENSFWSSQSCLRRLVDHRCPGDWGRHSPLVSGQGKQDAEERAGHSAEFCTEPAAEFYTILIKTTDTCLPSNTIAFLRPVKTPLIVSIVYVRKIALWQNNVNQYRGVLVLVGVLCAFIHLDGVLGVFGIGVDGAFGNWDGVSGIFIPKCEELCLYSLGKPCSKQPLGESFQKIYIYFVWSISPRQGQISIGEFLWGTR